jgi:hypothetical protein
LFSLSRVVGDARECSCVSGERRLESENVFQLRAIGVMEQWYWSAGKRAKGRVTTDEGARG